MWQSGVQFYNGIKNLKPYFCFIREVYHKTGERQIGLIQEGILYTLKIL